jgi:hypothetical protein
LIRVAIVAAVAAIACPAAAQFKSMQIASALGSVLGSEKGCGLKYDQAAIEAYIEKNVSASDMEFVGTLGMMTEVTASDIEKMSLSQKTAHCAQIRRVARANKFIAE